MRACTAVANDAKPTSHDHSNQCGPLVQGRNASDNRERAVGDARHAHASDGSTDNQHLGRVGHAADQRADLEDDKEPDVCPLQGVRLRGTPYRTHTLALKFS